LAIYIDRQEARSGCTPRRNPTIRGHVHALDILSQDVLERHGIPPLPVLLCEELPQPKRTPALKVGEPPVPQTLGCGDDNWRERRCRLGESVCRPNRARAYDANAIEKRRETDAPDYNDMRAFGDADNEKLALGRRARA
jgi:hypothetical protein